jgi:hypothetical protein
MAVAATMTETGALSALAATGAAAAEPAASARCPTGQNNHMKYSSSLVRATTLLCVKTCGATAAGPPQPPTHSLFLLQASLLTVIRREHTHLESFSPSPPLPYSCAEAACANIGQSGTPCAAARVEQGAAQSAPTTGGTVGLFASSLWHARCAPSLNRCTFSTGDHGALSVLAQNSAAECSAALRV